MQAHSSTIFEVELVEEDDFLVLFSNGVGARVTRRPITGELVSPVVAGTLPVGESRALDIGPRGVAFVPLNNNLLGPSKIVDAIPEEPPQVCVGVAAGAGGTVASCVSIGHELAVGEDFKGGNAPDQHLVSCK